MFRICVLLLTVICVQYAYTDMLEKHDKIAENYGPYELVYNSYEVCKGPKLKDAANLQLNLEKNNRNEYIGYINFTMIDPASLGEIKIVVYSFKNGRKSVLFNYRLTKPCEHFAFAKPIEFYVQANKKNNCSIKKASFIFNINFTEYSKLFFGTSFFYGNYMFKVIVLSPKGNIMCLLSDINFNKI